jgi:predicted XRE-type DNA-binding protein
MHRTSPNRRRNSRRDPDAVHMAFRRQLFNLVLEIINRDSLSDTALATTLNVARTRASALRNGHLLLFNSETLVDILARLGVTVEASVARTQPYVRGFNPNPRPGWKPPRDAVRW